MGFVLDVDLETSEGPSHEVYVRIESLTFNKVTMEVKFQLTYWESKDYALRFSRTLVNEPKKNATGLIQERVIYFKDDVNDGEEILLPHFLKTPIVKTELIEVPQYEMKKVETEVPYVSFDEDGEEITKYRTVVKEEKVQVGTKAEHSEIYDYSATKNLFEYCYNYTKNVLSELVPENKIVID